MKKNIRRTRITFRQDKIIGAWRSLVAHHTGGVVVAGSNPAVPTKHVLLINQK